ncbi:MAG: aminopeptidase [Promethearchaeia archaeon]|nr:MAG: aminopeptidase [Candidatus Lokiarchaeia archaeon]
MNSKNELEASDLEPSDSSLEGKLTHKIPFAWEKYTDEQKRQVRDFSEDYLEFLRNARTERERTNWAVKQAQKFGFKRVELGKEINTLQPGDKIYYVNKHKNVALVVVGTQSMTEKTHLIGSHIDTPRLDLRVNPLVDDKQAGVGLFKTHYYGGIKKYQWTTVPLHLTGIIIKKDGTKVEIDVGRDAEDPVFTIPDLLIHLSSTVQAKRTMREVIKAEEMTVLAGGLPVADKKAKEKFKLNILQILNEKYGILEEDFLSAELNLVSGIPPRYIGFDKSMIGAAGHDDGVCAWTSARALFDLKKVPAYTSVVCFFDKEETGSNGATGAESKWLYFVMNDLMVRTGISENISNLNVVLSNSFMVSSDVSAAVDPAFKTVHDIQNAAILGKGITLVKYTGSGGKYSANDANAETVAYMRQIFSKAEVPFQMGQLGEVDKGGGGTIAKYMAETFNCEVIDVGTPVLNMHSPYEIVHIADVYATYLGYLAFLGYKQ